MALEFLRKEKVFLRGRGGSDAAHKADEKLFEALLTRHTELERVTEHLENGITAVTRVVSGDTELVKVLQEHALGMKKRFDSGRAIRSWDPLFAKLFDARKSIEMSWEMVEDGITMSLLSEDQEIQELIKLHDETLHAFIKYGYQAARHESPYRQFPKQ